MPSFKAGDDGQGIVNSQSRWLILRKIQNPTAFPHFNVSSGVITGRKMDLDCKTPRCPFKVPSHLRHIPLPRHLELSDS
jgi:hypothetical protein